MKRRWLRSCWCPHRRHRVKVAGILAPSFKQEKGQEKAAVFCVLNWGGGVELRNVGEERRLVEELMGKGEEEIGNGCCLVVGTWGVGGVGC